MARYKINRRNDSSYDTPRPRRRRFKRRYLLAMSFFGILIAIIIGTPMLLQNKSFVVSMANKYGGIQPLTIDLDTIRAGWLTPIAIDGLRVSDSNGNKLVEVGQIEMKKGLLGFATNYSDLSLITVRNSQVFVSVEPGTTNLEEALKPLMKPSSSESSFMPKGKIKLENMAIHLRDSIDLSAWDLIVSDADLPLPSKQQPIPAVSLAGVLRPASSDPSLQSSTGPIQPNFAVKVVPIDGSAGTSTIDSSTSQPIKLVASVQQVPLHWWNLVKRRLPELPIDSLQGSVTMQAEFVAQNADQWAAQIGLMQVDQLVATAPAFLGNSPAKLLQTNLVGKIAMNQGRIDIDGLKLQSDAAQLAGTISMPAAMTLPTATRPWLENSSMDLRGTIDVAKLQTAIPGLISMQEQAQLISGQATLSAQQSMNEGVYPTCHYQLRLGNLVANISGVPMKWDQALDADVQIKSNAAGQPDFTLKCLAEFCDLAGRGDLNRGELTAKLDLDRLQQRLSKWFTLPVTNLSGSASLAANWKQDESRRIQLTGNLSTTPMRIGLPSGGLNEPAWKGSFDATGRLENNSLTQIDRATLVLQGDAETLQADLIEPIMLIDPPMGIQPLPPAGVRLKLVGDLAGWQRRGQIIAGYDPGIKLGGKCDLQIQGLADKQHVEVATATWLAEPFTVEGNGLTVFEPKMQGEFNGRVDSQDISRLQVDKLIVQASSFAISAKDAAINNGGVGGRQGQAAFRVDPKRFLTSMSNPSAKAVDQVLVEGDVTGRASWVVDSTAITWQLDSDAKDLKLVQLTAPGQGTLVGTSGAKPTTSVLWSEPLTKAAITGRYDIASGSIELPQTQVQTEWLAYAGSTQIANSKEATQITANGQMTYDAATIAERMRPWVGNYVAVSGQRTSPVELTWSSAGKSWAESLQAKTRIGWDSANVVGIDVGTADVPVTIENGHLKSKTEIPVSQGALRWDLDGDVGSDPIVIHQAPQVVLDNVAITPQMCQGWLKYVAPLLAEVTKVEGRLSLKLDEAKIVPLSIRDQKFAGQLQLHGATVGPGPLADQLLIMVQQIRALRKGATAATANPTATWLTMPQQQIDFAVDAGRVLHRNLQMTAGDVVIQTSGEVAIDGTVQMVAQVPIRKEWVDSTPALASLAGQSIQLPITGTLQRPQVDYRNLGQLTMQMAQGAAQGYLQKQLDKGLNKLLGPMQQGIQNIPIPQGFPLPQGVLPGQPAAAPGVGEGAAVPSGG